MSLEATVCKRFEFSAAHHLPDYDGPCARNHGHNFIVEVIARGPVQEDGPEKGMVVDFSRLKDAWRRVEDLLDHQDLNDLFEHPSTEIVAHAILSKLRQDVREVVTVRLWETPKQYAEASVPTSPPSVIEALAVGNAGRMFGSTD